MEKELSLLERLQQDETLLSLWNRLGKKSQQYFLEIDRGQRVPDLLNDTIFKGIFDPDEHRERLSQFVSSILGKRVTVLHSLATEGRRHSMYSKGIILDLVVQFEDGSIGNVEIQRYGVAFPPQRAACYSADLVKRQYAVQEGKKKGEIDFETIQPVYTIIIMEDSPATFKDSDCYVHHFRQTSDSGVELELVQYYDYVCLDKFREIRPRVAGELEKWLTFLSIQDVEEMMIFLSENSSFQPVYNCAILMTKDREGLMHMFTDLFEHEDIVASLNRTNESKIKRLEKELAERDSALVEKENALAEKDSELAELKKQLKEYQKQNT